MLVFDTFIETLETKLPRCVCHKYCRLQKRLPPKPRKTVPNRRAEQAPLALAALSSHELGEANGPGSAVSRGRAEAAAGRRARGHGVLPAALARLSQAETPAVAARGESWGLLQPSRISQSRDTAYSGWSIVKVTRFWRMKKS